MRLFHPLFPLLACVTLAFAAPPEGKRIVFLGDSITDSGQYLQMLETVLLVETDKRYEFLNLGLASETVSGLSEPGHAGGKFPRPDLHERLDRILAKTKPDIITACYGMNDGIYFPFSDKRFNAFTSGMKRLRTKAKAANVQVIHFTPPVFDPVPIKDKTLPSGLNAYPKPFEGYNRVLSRYGAWLLSNRADGWDVVDIHGPMNTALDERRKDDAAYTFAKDGVHPNAEGHWVMAEAILSSWGVKHGWKLDDLTSPDGALHPLFKLVGERQRVLHQAWLSECGHKRPGVSAGLPLAEAQQKAGSINDQIQPLLANAPKPVAVTSAKTKTKTEEVRPAVPTNSTPTTTTEGSKPAMTPSPAEPGLYPGKRSDWNGFDRYDFDWNGHKASIVAPKSPAPGKPWVWHGEFFGHRPQPDIALLGKGFHCVFLSLPDTLGAPSTVKIWTEFYQHLVKQYKFSKKPALVGLSRGGLYCYNWAAANPDKVACIYGDAPVCDFKSWPGGKGASKGNPENWSRVLTLWSFKDEAEALAYKGNPVDSLSGLAKRKIPILHVFGDADDVVPADENTLLLAERYRKLGGQIELIAKAGGGHHPHGLEDSSPIVNFIVKHASGK